ncbi:MAG: UPF0175 family protein [Candidatus Wallbacteria bacterium]|nr:UPF0175 family protein [Candidatus Wallbacteria bacterium]
MTRPRTMKSTKVEYPESILIALKENEKEFVSRMKLLAAVKLFETGKLSIGQAAELAGMPRREFIPVLSSFQVSIFNLTEAELSKDIQNA